MKFKIVSPADDTNTVGYFIVILTLTRFEKKCTIFCKSQRIKFYLLVIYLRKHVYRAFWWKYYLKRKTIKVSSGRFVRTYFGVRQTQLDAEFNDVWKWWSLVPSISSGNRRRTRIEQRKGSNLNRISKNNENDESLIKALHRYEGR